MALLLIDNEYGIVTQTKHWFGMVLFYLPLLSDTAAVLFYLPFLSDTAAVLFYLPLLSDTAVVLPLVCKCCGYVGCFAFHWAAILLQCCLFPFGEAHSLNDPLIYFVPSF